MNLGWTGLDWIHVARLYDDADIDTDETHSDKFWGWRSTCLPGMQSLHFALTCWGACRGTFTFFCLDSYRAPTCGYTLSRETNVEQNMMFFHILTCLSVRPPIWAGPDWTVFM